MGRGRGGDPAADRLLLRPGPARRAAGGVLPGGVGEDHRAHVAAWWSEVLGGPARYTEELGGYERMLAHHRGLAITPEQRLRFATLLSRAADDAGLPDDPEFRSALVAYVEWGTRLAMHNSQPGAEVAEHAPRAEVGLGRSPSLPAVGRPFAPFFWLPSQPSGLHRVSAGSRCSHAAGQRRRSEGPRLSSPSLPRTRTRSKPSGEALEASGSLVELRWACDPRSKPLRRDQAVAGGNQRRDLLPLRGRPSLARVASHGEGARSPMEFVGAAYSRPAGRPPDLIAATCSAVNGSLSKIGRSW